MVLKLIQKYNNEKFNYTFYVSNNELVKSFGDLNISITVLKENIFSKLHRIFLSNSVMHKKFSAIGLRFGNIERNLMKDNVDLVYFLSPNIVSQGLSNIPYVFTLWDLGHLDVLEFPEVSHNRIFEARERLYTQCLKKAVSVTVDSKHGKKYACKKYNLDEKRVKVLPFLPNIVTAQSNNIDVKKKYGLKYDYIFYPAQFWAHKNHIYILKAIKILKEEKNILIDVVFCGSDKGNLEHILNKAEEYGIAELIHYIGFVPNEDIPDLYKQALSLVMPTYLGPTNIPPLEAFAYKTPVCYSDLPCFKEQVKGAAFFIDLADPRSLVSNLQLIRNNEAVVREKVDIGTQVINDWNGLDFYKKLESIFKKYSYIRECWE
jgi:glycosyltransferase involved in cell wall biosynthesis